MKTRPDTRRWGLVLIAIVLLTAAVAPNLGTRTVPGTAQAAPVAGPPSAGDCVSDPIDPSWENPDVVHDASGTITTRYAYPQLAMGPCTGSRYGEVTVVIDEPEVPVIADGSDGITVNDANAARCSLAADPYVDDVVVGTEIGRLTGPWFRSQVVAAAASIPSVRQTAVGQHWLACIVYLGASAGDPKAYGDQERYDGVLQHALTTGVQRDRLGTCTSGTDLAGEPVSCSTVHQSELVAFGTNGAKAGSLHELQNSCNASVMEATGIPEVGAAGLVVSVQALDRHGSPVTSASVPPMALLSCGVQAEHHHALKGSVLALGRRPIPWA